ncbi:hypothetical protein ACP275_08G257800 [Erythranthe tilingii]
MPICGKLDRREIQLHDAANKLFDQRSQRTRRCHKLSSSFEKIIKWIRDYLAGYCIPRIKKCHRGNPLFDELRECRLRTSNFVFRLATGGSALVWYNARKIM